MVKSLFFFLIFTNLVYANSINKEVKNILGKGSYAAKKGLISVLFKKQSDFMSHGRVDILKVLTKLKNNKLLDLQFKGARTLELSFATTGKKPLLFVKTIKDVLSAVGYNHTLTTKAVQDESGFLWKVSLRGAAMLDPLLLANELQKRGAYFTSVKRYSKESWRYNVFIDRATVKSRKISFNKNVSLKRPYKPYWIDIAGARVLNLKSHRANIWHPYIIFYDKDLNIVTKYTKERKSYNVALKIPRTAKYVKIGDLYTLKNLKRGLQINIVK